MSLPISSISVPPYGWITPEKQLSELTLPERQPVIQILEQRSLPTAVADLVSYYALDSSWIDPNLIHWYTTLERLKALPKRISRLPGNIREILKSRCLFYWNRIKPDGSYYQVTDTHLLTLISKELGTLNLCAKRIRRYCQKHKLKDADAFQFRHFWKPACRKYANAPFEPTHWELSLNLIPGSLNFTSAEQDLFIASLKQKIYVVYQPLSLKSTIVALFLHKLATGGNLYPKGKEEEGSDSSYTLVQESAQNQRLVVGEWAADGLVISFIFDYQSGIGSGVCRRFF